MASVEETIKEIVVKELGVRAEEITSEASFVEDLGADSLHNIQLIMAFEEEFGIEIPDEDAQSIATVGQAIEYVKNKTGQ